MADAHGLACLGAEPDIAQVPQQGAPAADVAGAALSHYPQHPRGLPASGVRAGR